MNINFELVLVIAAVITGIVWIAVELFRCITKKDVPKWLASFASFFPILFLVLIIRTFIFEPFRIPSGSLKPTLEIGDFIIVNKFDYGLRWPVFNKKIMNTTALKRGDIVVFYWPADPRYYFIKRVIGLPGDKISYKDKTIYINGEPMVQTDLGQVFDSDKLGNRWLVQVKKENLGNVEHKIWVRPDFKAYDLSEITVPKNMYFMMGDNRDNSEDSRFWGFVPDKNIVGKASFVVFSWDSKHSTLRRHRFFHAIH